MSDFTAKAMTGVCTLYGLRGDGGRHRRWQNHLSTKHRLRAGSDYRFSKIYHADGMVQYILSFNNWTEYTFTSTGLGIGITATFAKEHAFTLPVSGYLSRVMRLGTC